MEIKQLFVDADSYQRWVQSLLDVSPNDSLWREEDVPKLEPFFCYQARRSPRGKMNDEESASFEHYRKCYAEYGHKAAELRDSLRQFSFEDIIDIFGFELTDPDNDYCDEIKLYAGFPYEFPFIVTGYIDSGYSRGAEDKMAAISIISLSEFNLIIDDEPKLDKDLQPIPNYNEDRDDR